jgi:uncharacterized membrane protein
LDKVDALDKISLAFFEHAFPADLKATFVLLVANLAVLYAPFLYALQYKMFFSIPILLFIPGFCIIAILYPRDGDLSLPQRILLSFGFSVPVVSLLAIGLYISPWVLQLDSLILLSALVSVVLILAAQYRRAMVRSQDAYHPRFSEIPDALRHALAPLGGDRIDRLLSVALVLVMIIAITATILVIALPKENEYFTDFFILGANRMAADYPYEIVTGQYYPMYFGVANHEKRNASYTIETWSMNASFNTTTNATGIVSMDPGDRFSLSLANNETTILPYSFVVKNPEDNRIAFLLFNETVPGPEVTGSDRVNASYRDLYLRVSVGQAFYQNDENNVTENPVT